MKKLLIFYLLLFAFALPAFGQYGTANQPRYLGQRASDPLLCAVSSYYYNTVSAKFRYCSATNTWADWGISVSGGEGGAATWGLITGTLGDQTDLSNALALKAPLASPTFTGTVSGITAAMVGLGNVDNTSDATKWAATATLTNKTLTAPIFSGTITGTYTLGGTPTFPASVVTTTGTQTLTNKTLTSPVINLGSDATGDIYYRNSGGAFTRLGVGSNGQVLTLSGGLPSWQNASGGGGGLSYTSAGTTNALPKFDGTGFVDSGVSDNGTTVALASGRSFSLLGGNFSITPAANTTPLSISGYSLTGSNTQPIINLAATVATDTPTNLINLELADAGNFYAHNFINFKKNGTSLFTVDSYGGVTATGTFNTNGGYFAFGGNIEAYAGSFRGGPGVGWKITAPADGQLLLQNHAGTDAAAILMGGTTASFPALKRNATNLEIKLADDSAYTGVVASKFCYAGTTVCDFVGSGSPEGAVTASVGSTYRRTDGGANTTFYVKESGTSTNTGWQPK